MKNSKTKSMFYFLGLIALVCGCQSSKKFEMKTLDFSLETLHVVETDRNRIIQECYFVNAEKENNWRHQYILALLNEKNEVIPVFNPTNQGKEECMAHLKKVEKVLKNSPRVRLCVRDKLEKWKDPTARPDVYDFGPLGKYDSTYHALGFDTICNAKECHSISDTWIYTCPDFIETSKKALVK